MKKNAIYLILVFSILLQNDLTAQMMTDEGNQWNVYTCGMVPGSERTHSIRVNGDSLIGGKNYKILEKSIDMLGNNWFFDSVIRQDSAGRVYYGESDELLYDFSLEIGDTIISNEYCKVVVTGIDTITLLNGEKRKRLKLETSDFPFEYDYWIDGVGSDEGIFRPYGIDAHFCATDGCRRLLCFSQFELVLYPLDYDDCWIEPTSVKELSGLDNILVSPNPFRTKLILSNINRIDRVNIYSLSGGKICEIEVIGEDKREIDSSTWKNGIYILQAQSRGGKIFRKKIIRL